MAMTALPTPPQRGQSQSVFSSNADAFLAALPTFVTEANALQTDVTSKQSTATTQATNAANSATAAANSATAAANSASGINATSTTSLTIAVGAQTFTTQSGKLFAAGQNIFCVSNSAPTKWMFGQVTSYTGTSLVLSIATINGSGAVNDWNISICGPQGIQGSSGVTLSNVTAALVTASDIGAGVPTRLAVDQASDGNFKWQTIANFFNKIGQALHLNANRGRVLTASSGLTLIAGNIYKGDTSGGAYAVNLPTIANSAVGDEIVILNPARTWGANNLTINCASGVYIHTGASGESALLSSNTLSGITLMCSNTNSSTYAYWSLI